MNIIEIVGITAAGLVFLGGGYWFFKPSHGDSTPGAVGKNFTVAESGQGPAGGKSKKNKKIRKSKSSFKK
jgi:hypothetical protein